MVRARSAVSRPLRWTVVCGVGLLVGCRPSGEAVPSAPASGSAEVVVPAPERASHWDRPLQDDPVLPVVDTAEQLQLPPAFGHVMALRRQLPATAPWLGGREARTTTWVTQRWLDLGPDLVALLRGLDDAGIDRARTLWIGRDAEANRFLALALREGVDDAVGVRGVASLLGDAPGEGPAEIAPGTWRGDRYAYVVVDRQVRVGMDPDILRSVRLLTGATEGSAGATSGAGSGSGAGIAPASTADLEWNMSHPPGVWRRAFPGLVGLNAQVWFPSADAGLHGEAAVQWAENAVFPTLLSASTVQPIACDDTLVNVQATVDVARLAEFLREADAYSRTGEGVRMALAPLFLPVVQPLWQLASAVLNGHLVFEIENETRFRLRLGLRADATVSMAELAPALAVWAPTLGSDGQSLVFPQLGGATLRIAHGWLQLQQGEWLDMPPAIDANAAPLSGVAVSVPVEIVLPWLSGPDRIAPAQPDACIGSALHLQLAPGGGSSTLRLRATDAARDVACRNGILDAAVHADAREAALTGRSYVRRLVNAAERWARREDRAERVVVFPPDSPLTPPREELRTACDAGDGVLQPSAARWDTSPWRELDFLLYEPHRHAYSFEAEGSGMNAQFTVTAVGDLDCDGVYSTFQGRGRWNGDSVDFTVPEIDDLPLE
jgi:hypothetical protein